MAALIFILGYLGIWWMEWEKLANATGTGQTLLIIERERSGGKSSPWAWREDWVGGYNMLDRSCRQILDVHHGDLGDSAFSLCVLFLAPPLQLASSYGRVSRKECNFSISVTWSVCLSACRPPVSFSLSQSSGCIFHSLGCRTSWGGMKFRGSSRQTGASYWIDAMLSHLA